MTSSIVVSAAFALIFANQVLSDSQQCYWCSSIAGAAVCSEELKPASSWVFEQTCPNNTGYVCATLKMINLEVWLYERRCVEVTRDGKEFCEYVVDDIEANNMTLVQCRTCATDFCNTDL